MNVVIVGGGEIGALVAAALHRSHGVTVIDPDPERGRAFETMDVRFVPGNGADPTDLRAGGIERADAFIACTTNDDVNVLACLAAKGLADVETMAFVTRQRYLDAFAAAGALEALGLAIDRVLWPQRTLARQIVDIVRVPRALASAGFAGGRLTMLEYRLEPHDPFLGEPLGAAALPPGVLVAGAIRGDRFTIPSGATTLQAGDKVVFMGSAEPMKTVQQRFSPRRRSLDVALVGGGNVGFMVAEQLAGDRADITIIEQHEARCEKLAQWLPHALVLKGDGTDLELLQQERIEKADVMVAVTDDDGKNLLVSLLSKQLGIPKVITRVGRSRNRRLFERVGIDAPLTPRAAAVQEVLNWLRVDQVDHLASIEDRAEVMELSFPPGCRGGRVRDIGAPRDSLIGAVLRGDRVFVPHGDTEVRPGDRLFIVTTPDNTGAVERWLETRRAVSG